MKTFDRAAALLKKTASSGFFDIVLSGTAAKAIAFLSVATLTRLISKSDFGLLSYTDNVRNYFLLVEGLGLQNSILRYLPLTAAPEQKQRLFRSCAAVGTLINLCLAVLAVVIFSFFELPLHGSSPLMVSMAFLPVLNYLFDCSQLYLRAEFKNRTFSLLSVLYSACSLLFQIVPAFFWGIQGAVAGRYLGFAVTLPVCAVFVPYFRHPFRRTFLNRKPFGGIFRYGLLAMLANCTSMIVPLNELFILGWLIHKADLLAEYRAAAVFPQMLSYFSLAVATFIFPYFTKNQDNRAWLRDRYRKVVLLLTALLLPFLLLLTAFPSLFLYIVYGSRYAGGGNLLRILLLANFINICFRVPTGNILAAVGDVKFNFFNSLACLVLHVGAEIALVSRLGIYGSPLALAFVYAVTGAASFLYFQRRFGMLRTDYGTSEPQESFAHAPWNIIGFHLLASDASGPEDGFDRLIEGLRFYYESNPECNVYLHLQGRDGRLRELLLLALSYGLGSYVVIEDCETICRNPFRSAACSMVTAPLGLHRLMKKTAGSRDTRTFLPSGLPFLYAGDDPPADGKQHGFRCPACDDPIDLAATVAFWQARCIERRR